MSVPIEVVFLNGGVFTVLLAILAFFIKKWMIGLEERMKDLCLQIKTKVGEPICAERRKVITDLVEDVCSDKTREHDDLWDVVKHHKHSPEGQVIDTTRG